MIFRQVVRSLEFKRILRRHHHERAFQRARLVLDADLLLAHRFQQRRLGPRRRSIDLVGQHDVGENRTRLEIESLRLAVVDRNAEHIAGQQVGSQQKAAEFAVDAAGETFGEHRFAHAGHVLDEHVSASEQTGQQQIDRFGVAEKNGFDICPQPIDQFIRHASPESQICYDSSSQG